MGVGGRAHRSSQHNPLSDDEIPRAVKEIRQRESVFGLRAQQKQSGSTDGHGAEGGAHAVASCQDQDNNQVWMGAGFGEAEVRGGPNKIDDEEDRQHNGKFLPGLTFQSSFLSHLRLNSLICSTSATANSGSSFRNFSSLISEKTMTVDGSTTWAWLERP